jgi:hypothetical protein
VIGNVHYVGSEQLASFLITAPEGNILINSSFYGLPEKYARLDKGGGNPFIDPEGFKAHPDRQEKSFIARLDEQKKAPAK